MNLPGVTVSNFIFSPAAPLVNSSDRLFPGTEFGQESDRETVGQGHRVSGPGGGSPGAASRLREQGRRATRSLREQSAHSAGVPARSPRRSSCVNKLERDRRSWTM